MGYWSTQANTCICICLTWNSRNVSVNFILNFSHEAHFTWINVRHRIGCDVSYTYWYIWFLREVYLKGLAFRALVYFGAYCRISWRLPFSEIRVEVLWCRHDVNFNLSYIMAWVQTDPFYLVRSISIVYFCFGKESVWSQDVLIFGVDSGRS